MIVKRDLRHQNDYFELNAFTLSLRVDTYLNEKDLLRMTQISNAINNNHVYWRGWERKVYIHSEITSVHVGLHQDFFNKIFQWSPLTISKSATRFIWNFGHILGIVPYRNSATPQITFLILTILSRKNFRNLFFLHLINMGKFSNSYHASDIWVSSLKFRI